MKFLYYFLWAIASFGLSVWASFDSYSINKFIFFTITNGMVIFLAGLVVGAIVRGLRARRFGRSIAFALILPILFVAFLVLAANRIQPYTNASQPLTYYKTNTLTNTCISRSGDIIAKSRSFWYERDGCDNHSN